MVSVGLLRFADKYAGTPLCLLLTFIRYLFYPLHRHAVLPAPKRILIIKLSDMAGSVLVYPAAEEIRKQVPGANIFFLVLANNRAVLDILKITKSDNIVAVDISSVLTLISSGWKAVRRLRCESIDTTIDMDFFCRFSAVAAFLVCRGNRVGFHRFMSEGLNRGRLLTHEVIYSAHVHASVSFMALVKTLFNKDAGNVMGRELITERELPVPSYRPDPGDVELVRGKLCDVGIDLEKRNLRLVVLNVDVSGPSALGRWPLNNFISLSSRLLSARNDICVVITGTDAGRHDADVIMDSVRYPRCVSLAGKTTIAELLALYSISSLIVTNESGPAHLAVLTKLPSVVLFGPDTPAVFAPMGRDAICLYSGYACSPCMSAGNPKTSPCIRSYCLEAITVDEVLGCSMKVLDDAAAKSRGQGPAD